MEIILNLDYTGTVIENYSQLIDGEEIEVFSEVCKMIDELNIAKFSVCFKKWDNRFNKTDFAYDFTSIAIEIRGLIDFLTNKSNKYLLFFYELDRKIMFRFKNEQLIDFEILNSIENTVFFSGILNVNELKNKVEKLLDAFRDLLYKFFPKAYECLSKHQYII